MYQIIQREEEHPSIRIEHADSLLTLALDVVIFEVSLVRVSVGPRENTVTLLDTMAVVTFEFRSIGPSLYTFAILCVVLPEATIEATILVEIVSKAMCLVSKPFSLVNVAIFMQQSTKIVGFIIHPVTFVETAVWPHLHAFPLLDVRLDGPFAKVNRTIMQLSTLSLLPLHKVHLLLFSPGRIDKWSVSHDHLLNLCSLLLCQVLWANGHILFDCFSS